MALLTGFQLKAARGLVGMNQARLAEASRVNINTIRKMESCGFDMLASGFETVKKVERALESNGIVFLSDGSNGPGVRLREPIGGRELPQLQEAG